MITDRQWTGARGDRIGPRAPALQTGLAWRMAARIAATAVVLVTLVGCQSSTRPPVEAIDSTYLSTAEYQDAMWSAIMADYPAHPRPEIEVVRVIADDAFGEYFTDCMADEGMPVTVLEDNSFQANKPVSDPEAFSLAMYTCEARFPRPFLLPRFMSTVTLSAASAHRLYVYYRDDLLPCLIGAGFSPDTLPSETTFVAELDSERRYFPYDVTVGDSSLSAAEWSEINMRCPQAPTSWSP